MERRGEGSRGGEKGVEEGSRLEKGGEEGRGVEQTGEALEKSGGGWRRVAVSLRYTLST